MIDTLFYSGIRAPQKIIFRSNFGTFHITVKVRGGWVKYLIKNKDQ